jgi:hypothetical protein
MIYLIILGILSWLLMPARCPQCLKLTVKNTWSYDNPKYVCAAHLTRQSGHVLDVGDANFNGAPCPICDTPLP